MVCCTRPILSEAAKSEIKARLQGFFIAGNNIFARRRPDDLLSGTF